MRVRAGKKDVFDFRSLAIMTTQGWSTPITYIVFPTKLKKRQTR